MPPAEWAHRARTAVRVASDRRSGTGPGWRARGVEGWPRPEGAPALVTDADAARARAMPGAVEEARAGAEAIAEGRIAFFGHGEATVAEPIDWHHDPTSGHDWPRVHWSRIDYRAAGGDPKWIWELGRHQHVVHLARAWRLTGDDRFAEAAGRHLEGFIEQSPPGVGIHWRVGLEVGVRLISWAWAVELLRGSPAATAALDARIAESVDAHLRYLARYPSLHSSANNHRLGELAGAVVGGLSFPGVPGAPAQAEAALAELGRELERQVHPDGVDAELSPAYQSFVLDLCLAVAASLSRLGRAVPEPVAGRTAAMADLLGYLAGDAGTLPRIGDDDDAVGIDLDASLDDPARLASRLRSTSLLLGRPPARAFPGTDQQTAWLCGALADAPPQGERLPGSASFVDGGLAVLRRRDERGEVRAVLKAGPFGMGPLFAHGHADLLSLCLSVWGEEAVVDPGAFTYFGERRWRDWARSTGAHSTLRVDGREQAEPSGAFMWRNPPRAHLDAVREAAGVQVAEAHHTAYDPVRHDRRVELAADGTVTVTDTLSGPPGPRRAEIRWHLGPGAVHQAGAAWLWDGAVGGLGVEVSGLGPVRAVEGCASRPLGFVSYRLEHREPAPALVAEGEVALPARIVSRLVPRAPGSP